MQCESASSTNTDAYRAGSEVGEGLAAAHPEVILLFVSPNYKIDFADVLAGLRDGLGSALPLVFGCTGDGIYETRNVAHHGISALGLNSGGRVQGAVATARGVAADSFGAAQDCARRALEKLGGKADFAFVMADGIKADGSLVVDGLRSVLPVPFLGGLAADDRKFTGTFVLVGEEILEDAVAVLLAHGDLRIWMNAASGWTPIGKAGTIEACQGNVIERISGLTANEFMRQQLGKSPSEVDIGLVPLATSSQGDADHLALRAPLSFDAKAGTVTVVGSIERGASVRVCTATRAEVIAGVDQALQDAPRQGFKAAAALIVSCAGRKWVTGNHGHEEVERVFAALGRRLPLAGFPSFGEIAPFRRADGTYTSTRFHNVTFTLCLIGE